MHKILHEPKASHQSTLARPQFSLLHSRELSEPKATLPCGRALLVPYGPSAQSKESGEVGSAPKHPTTVPVETAQAINSLHCLAQVHHFVNLWSKSQVRQIRTLSSTGVAVHKRAPFYPDVAH